MFFNLRPLLLFLCVVLTIAAAPISMDGHKLSPKELNPPFASSFMNCDDIDFGVIRNEDIPRIKKLFGCTYTP